MNDDLWAPRTATKSAVPIEALQRASQSSLANPAIVWRAHTPEEPIPLRLLYSSAMGATFICPLPLEPFEKVEMALEAEGKRLVLHIVSCENLNDEAYRVAAHL